MRNASLPLATVVLLVFAFPVMAQGVASRGVRPLPRGEPSGIPFPAKFVDVAAEAGLHRPTIYGEDDLKTTFWRRSEAERHGSTTTVAAGWIS